MIKVLIVLEMAKLDKDTFISFEHVTCDDTISHLTLSVKLVQSHTDL